MHFNGPSTISIARCRLTEDAFEGGRFRWAVAAVYLLLAQVTSTPLFQRHADGSACGPPRRASPGNGSPVAAFHVTALHRRIPPRLTNHRLRLRMRAPSR